MKLTRNLLLAVTLPCLVASAQAPAAASPQPATNNPNPTKAPEPASFQDIGPRKKLPPPPPPESNPEPVKAPGDQDQPQTPADTDQPKFRATTNLVDVVFTVTDRHGRFVKNLKADDIRVLDNKKPPEKIVSFTAQTDLPLRVGLLIDASSSIRERFKFEQEAAAEFMASIIRSGKDKAFILGFDVNPEVTQDFTSDTALLAKGVRMLRPGGGTALYDAVYAACRKKLLKTGDSEPVRKAIILVSDGDDNQSQVTREEAIEMAQRAEVIIYAISTNNSGTYGKGDTVLGQMASATGGRAFYPFKIEELSNAFNDVQEELRSQYSIAYIPANFAQDGSFHTIEIDVNDKKYKARARRGYFAQSAALAPASSGNGK